MTSAAAAAEVILNGSPRLHRDTGSVAIEQGDVTEIENTPVSPYHEPGCVSSSQNGEEEVLETSNADAGSPTAPRRSSIATIGDRGGVRKAALIQKMTSSFQSPNSSFRDRTMASTSSDVEGRREESSDESQSMAPLLVPLVHVGWYLIILYISMHMVRFHMTKNKFAVIVIACAASDFEADFIRTPKVCVLKYNNVFFLA